MSLLRRWRNTDMFKHFPLETISHLQIHLSSALSLSLSLTVSIFLPFFPSKLFHSRENVRTKWSQLLCFDSKKTFEDGEREEAARITSEVCCCLLKESTYSQTSRLPAFKFLGRFSFFPLHCRASGRRPSPFHRRPTHLSVLSGTCTKNSFFPVVLRVQLFLRNFLHRRQ